MKATLIFLLFLVQSLCFAQLASWNNGSFKELDKKSGNNLKMWNEGNQFNYEEVSRNQNAIGEVEVLLNDLNGRSGMQVRLTNNTSYWKYQKDANWIVLYAGSWSIIPSFDAPQKTLASWNNGSFKELDKNSGNNLKMWNEGNQFNYEEVSRNQNANGEVEVLLNDLNGRSGMQVRLTNNTSYWKYQKDANWIVLYAGSWSVKPSINTSPVINNPPPQTNVKDEDCEVARNKYLEQNQDVKKANIDPWLHYTNYGKSEGRIWPSCFKSVKIGTQTWTTENLNVSTFRNGDPIPEAKTDEEWKRADENKQPAWCYYVNDPKNGVKYGKLYNWYAVNDPRGLAPAGWHIPTDEEWTTLENQLGDDGKKMKSTSGWNSWEEDLTCKNCESWNAEYRKKTACHICKDTRVNTKRKEGNGTNSSGFSGLPGGYRYNRGGFSSIGFSGAWWSSTEYSTDVAYDHGLFHNYDDLFRSFSTKEQGFSVRCLRD